MTAATLVGLMSVPGLVVLYGGVMQKRWSVNAMMMAFIGFALVLVTWVLFGFKMGFGSPVHLFGAKHGIFANMIGKPASILSAKTEQGQAAVSSTLPPASSWSRWAAASCGSVGTGSTAAPPTTPA